MGNKCCGLCAEREENGAGQGDGNRAADQQPTTTSDTAPLLDEAEPVAASGDHVHGDVAAPLPSSSFRAASLSSNLASSLAKQSLQNRPPIILTAEQELLNVILQQTANQIIDCSAAAATANQSFAGSQSPYPGRQSAEPDDTELDERAVVYGRRLSKQVAHLLNRHFPRPSDHFEEHEEENDAGVDLILSDSGANASVLVSQDPGQILRDTDQFLVSEVVSRARDTIVADLQTMENELKTSLLVPFGVDDILQDVARLDDENSGNRMIT